MHQTEVGTGRLEEVMGHLEEDTGLLAAVILDHREEGTERLTEAE